MSKKLLMNCNRLVAEYTTTNPYSVHTFNEDFKYIKRAKNNGDSTYTVRCYAHKNFTEFKCNTDTLTIDYLRITEELTSMDEMFYGCTSLSKIDTTDWEMCNVTSMMNTFSSCNSLITLDTSCFKTSKVTNMSGLFHDCLALPAINLLDFDTTNVTDMSYMFSGCETINSLDFSFFKTNKVTNMTYMFERCSSIGKLNLGTFSTNIVTDMSHMFEGCTLLKSINLSSFNTRNVKDMSYMFSDCETINCSASTTNWEGLDISKFDTSNVTDMSYMFNNCKTLEVNSQYDKNYSVKSIHKTLNSLNTSNVTNMSHMFSGCSKYALSGTITPTFDTSSVTDMSYMFSDFGKITTSSQYSTTINICNLDTGNVIDMSYMFNGSCFRTISFDSIDTKNVRTMKAMFKDCKKITSLWFTTKGRFDVSSLLDMSYMFDGCSSLNEIVSKTSNGYYNTAYDINTSNVTDMSYMFNGCTSLDGEYVNLIIQTGSATNLSHMFNGCSSLTSLDWACVSNWNTSNVTNMEFLFGDCKALTTLNLKNWDTRNVKSFFGTFNNCSGLAYLNLSGWYTWDAENAMSMFYNVDRDVDWGYTSILNHYKDFHFTEDQTDFSGKFPWPVKLVNFKGDYVTDDSGSRELSASFFKPENRLDLNEMTATPQLSVGDFSLYRHEGLRISYLEDVTSGGTSSLQRARLVLEVLSPMKGTLYIRWSISPRYQGADYKSTFTIGKLPSYGATGDVKNVLDTEFTSTSKSGRASIAIDTDTSWNNYLYFTVNSLYPVYATIESIEFVESEE